VDGLSGRGSARRTGLARDTVITRAQQAAVVTSDAAARCIQAKTPGFARPLPAGGPAIDDTGLPTGLRAPCRERSSWGAMGMPGLEAAHVDQASVGSAVSVGCQYPTDDRTSCRTCSSGSS
jgi:hypothetical protein